MTCFADLTPCECFGAHEPLVPRPLNVGWLSGGMLFRKGKTSKEFRQKLFGFCADKYVVHLASGFQECEFCGLSWGDWHEKRKECYGAAHHWASLGNGRYACGASRTNEACRRVVLRL